MTSRVFPLLPSPFVVNASHMYCCARLVYLVKWFKLEALPIIQRAWALMKYILGISAPHRPHSQAQPVQGPTMPTKPSSVMTGIPELMPCAWPMLMIKEPEGSSATRAMTVAGSSV